MNYATEQEALSAAKQDILKYGPIEFDGMNCNDDLEEDDVECRGWDGVDCSRCQCGNRRVSWDIEKTSEGRYYALARAY